MARIVQMDYFSLSKHPLNISARRSWGKRGLRGSVWQIAAPQDDGKWQNIIRARGEDNLFFQGRCGGFVDQTEIGASSPGLTGKTKSDGYNIHLSPDKG